MNEVLINLKCILVIYLNSIRNNDLINTSLQPYSNSVLTCTTISINYKKKTIHVLTKL